MVDLVAPGSANGRPASHSSFLFSFKTTCWNSLAHSSAAASVFSPFYSLNPWRSGHKGG